MIASAAELVAEGGLDALTMRALADRLNVHANSLYSHVPGKGPLVELLVDEMLRAVPSPVETGEWQADLRSMMLRTYDVLLDHADLVGHVLGRGSRGAEAVRLGEAMHRLMRSGGIFGDQAERAVQVLIVYVIGFAAFATGVGSDDESPVTRGARMRENFEDGVSWLIGGLASDRRGRRAPAPRRATRR